MNIAEYISDPCKYRVTLVPGAHVLVQTRHRNWHTAYKLLGIELSCRGADSTAVLEY